MNVRSSTFSFIRKIAKCSGRRPPVQRNTMMGFMMLSVFIIVNAVFWCLKSGYTLNSRGPEENICECDSCQAGELSCLFIGPFGKSCSTAKLSNFEIMNKYDTEILRSKPAQKELGSFLTDFTLKRPPRIFGSLLSG